MQCDHILPARCIACSLKKCGSNFTQIALEDDGKRIRTCSVIVQTVLQYLADNQCSLLCETRRDTCSTAQVLFERNGAVERNGNVAFQSIGAVESTCQHKLIEARLIQRGISINNINLCPSLRILECIGQGLHRCNCTLFHQRGCRIQ